MKPARMRPPMGTSLGAAAVAVFPFKTYSSANGDGSTKSCSGVADTDASMKTWLGRPDACRGTVVVPMTLDVACVRVEGIEPV